jgi:hypothetical protein
VGEEVAVASVVYNMAGDEISRPDYMQTLVVRNVLAGGKTSMGDAIRMGQLAGPAMKLKQFYRWASSSTNYSTVGIPTAQLVAQGTVDADLVALHVPNETSEDLIVQIAVAEAADPTYWARQWILENREADVEADWKVEFITATNEINISFPDLTEETIPATDYFYNARYLYVFYAINIAGEFGDTRIWIYRIGSGNAALDAIIASTAGGGEFFPFIPLRISNNFLSESYLPAAYTQAKKALKRSIGGNFDDLVEKLEENDDVGDIDHAFVVFGTSLNTKDPAAKKYIYRFFEMLQASQPGGAASNYTNWTDYDLVQQQIADAWQEWYDGGSVGPEPPRPQSTSGGTNSIRISGSGEINSRYDVRIAWRFIQNGAGTGLGKPGAKKDEIWLQHTDTENVYRTYYTDRGTSERRRKVGEIQTMRIYWQRTDNSYTFLHVVGATHTNYIYKHYGVKIDIKQALADGDESGFIIPLHYDTWSTMSLKDINQMGVACCYAVFNCVEVRKTRWYESGIFRIFLVIVIAIASVVFTGGAGLGLLGTHLAVGSALGFTGMTAAIVGSVINALAAMLLATILEKTLGGLGVLGTILGTVIMIMVGQVSSAFNSGTLVLDWGQLLRVDNLLKLTDAVGRGLTNQLRNDTLQLQQDWLDFQENTKRETAKIQQAYFNEFGYGAGVIDPLMFVDGTSGPSNESSATFLTRTLMTGSEIAEMSRELLYGFPELSLKLPDAFT